MELSELRIVLVLATILAVALALASWTSATDAPNPGDQSMRHDSMEYEATVRRACTSTGR